MRRLIFFLPVVVLAFFGSYQIVLAQSTATPVTSTPEPTRTPVDLFSGGYSGSSDYSCPDDLPDGYGTLTPSSYWQFVCGDCFVGGSPTSVPTSTPTAVPTWDGTGTPPPTVTVTPTPTVDPSSTPWDHSIPVCSSSVYGSRISVSSEFCSCELQSPSVVFCELDVTAYHNSPYVNSYYNRSILFSVPEDTVVYFRHHKEYSSVNYRAWYLDTNYEDFLDLTELGQGHFLGTDGNEYIGIRLHVPKYQGDFSGSVDLYLSLDPISDVTPTPTPDLRCDPKPAFTDIDAQLSYDLGCSPFMMPEEISLSGCVYGLGDIVDVEVSTESESVGVLCFDGPNPENWSVAGYSFDSGCMELNLFSGGSSWLRLENSALVNYVDVGSFTLCDGYSDGYCSSIDSAVDTDDDYYTVTPVGCAGIPAFDIGIFGLEATFPGFEVCLDAVSFLQVNFFGVFVDLDLYLGMMGGVALFRFVIRS